MTILPGKHGLLIFREPIGACDVCEIPFYSEKDVRFHLASPAHLEAAQEKVQIEQERKERLAVIYEDPDPEVTEHMRKVGQRMLREGRWEVKKSERAGF